MNHCNIHLILILHVNYISRKKKKRGRTIWWLYYKDANLILKTSPSWPSNPNYLQRLHLQIHLIGVRPSTCEFRGDGHNSVHRSHLVFSCMPLQLPTSLYFPRPRIVVASCSHFCIAFCSLTPYIKLSLSK